MRALVLFLISLAAAGFLNISVVRAQEDDAHDRAAAGRAAAEELEKIKREEAEQADREKYEKEKRARDAAEAARKHAQ